MQAPRKLYSLEPPDAPLSAAQLFLRQARFRLRADYQTKLNLALAQVTEKQIWWRPNPASNSIGNLLLHLAGNVRQHIISGCGGKDDVRTRSKEFQVQFDEAQTPSKGVLSPKRLMTSLLMPASFGVHGPGEMQMWPGLSFAIWSMVIRSLRWICMSTPISPKYWTRL